MTENEACKVNRLVNMVSRRLLRCREAASKRDADTLEGELADSIQTLMAALDIVRDAQGSISDEPE